MSSLQQRIDAVSPDRLKGILRGEKESLRALPSGGLALTPHPVGLGSALTHSQITTDFSESQVELITRAHGNVQSVLDDLTELHQFTYRVLRDAGDEMLWASSMPCGLPTDETIPLARYGSSNIGRAKSVYRMGLRHRYGRRMRDHLGHSLQLVAAGSVEYRLLRADPQLPPSRFLADDAVRRFACSLLHLCRRTSTWPAVAAQWQHVHAVRHITQDGPPRLSKRCPVIARRELQQSGELRRIVAGRIDTALSSV